MSVDAATVAVIAHLARIAFRTTSSHLQAIAMPCLAFFEQLC